MRENTWLLVLRCCQKFNLCEIGDAALARNWRFLVGGIEGHCRNIWAALGHCGNVWPVLQ